MYKYGRIVILSFSFNIKTSISSSVISIGNISKELTPSTDLVSYVLRIDTENQPNKLILDKHGNLYIEKLSYINTGVWYFSNITYCV